jgi:hypothetical protein
VNIIFVTSIPNHFNFSNILKDLLAILMILPTISMMRHECILLLVHVDGVRLCLWTAATNGPTVHPQDYIWVWSHGRMILTRETWRTWKEICPSAILSTTNPTWIDLGTNPGLCGERLTSKCLSRVMNINLLFCELIYRQTSWLAPSGRFCLLL